MRNRIVLSGLAVLSAALLALPAAARQATPQVHRERGGAILRSERTSKPASRKPLSPPASASCQFSSGKTIDTHYSSPRRWGRTIFGGLVPWDKVWRMGANEATTFVVDADVIVGDKDVPAGAYTLDAIPTPTKWTLIISKKTKNDKGQPLWGIPYPGAQFDLARTDMRVSPLSGPLEDLTISYVPSGKVCTMHVDWGTTRASINIRQK